MKRLRSELASTARLMQIVAIFIFVISFVFKPDSLPKIDICLFHAVTGLQCPGCGMTRAFCAISHGQFAYAWRLNPLSFHLYALSALSLIYPFFVNVIPEKLSRTIVLMTVAALMLFGVLRILCPVDHSSAF